MPISITSAYWWGHQPPAVARVPRAVPLFPLSYLYSGGRECDFNEAREVLHPPPVRLSLEHLVLLDHRVEVLDSRADELHPLIPDLLTQRKLPPPCLLCRSRKGRACREMAIPDIELVGQLRVQVARVLEDVRVVCVDSEEVTSSENQIASKRDASDAAGVLGAILM